MKRKRGGRRREGEEEEESEYEPSLHFLTRFATDWTHLSMQLGDDIYHFACSLEIIMILAS